MNDDELLIRHAASWAAVKQRPLDAGTLADVLELRRANDELPDGAVFQDLTASTRGPAQAG